MQTKDFNYDLPEELIAQYPSEHRGGSRMLVMERDSGKCEIGSFNDIIDSLSSKDCVVFNNTRVMNARMYGKKDTGATIEVLLTSCMESKTRWQCLLKPRKRVNEGTIIKLLDAQDNISEDSFTVVKLLDDGTSIIEFNTDDIWELQEIYGHIPLPPYIKREDELDDKERYQTVYAKEAGAVAAPTAGLHFTPEILKKIADKGVTTTELTLHVGPGTFKPVSVEDVTQHKMHTEAFHLSEETAKIINSTRQNGGKVLAVGTTTVRVLESCATDDGCVKAQSGSTDIFLYPPYKPKVVDMLLTNFHLPQSTLLMLVSTFADREKVFAAYELAKEQKMRFYSYGDCMLLK